MKTSTRIFSVLSWAAAALMLAVFTASPIHAWNRGAMLSPTRVVIEGRDRAAVIKLINPDQSTNRYKITLINMRMDDLGRRTEVESPTPEEKAVIDMIRFSPRRATLGSKEWQTIRIMVRKPAGLAPGEYRAHLRVAPVPPDQLAPGEAGGSDGKNDEQDQERVSINLNVLFAITIPVIIRHGEGGVSVTAGKPSLKRQPDGKTYLEVPLTRSGNHSAYFDITAYQLTGGKRMKAGELKGVSIYTPNTRVYMSIPLEQGMVSRLSGSPVELVIHDLEKRETPVSGSWQFVLD